MIEAQYYCIPEKKKRGNGIDIFVDTSTKLKPYLTPS